MKKLIIFIFFIGTYSLSIGQSMTSIFRLLPVECTPELNSKQKEILLKQKEYTFPDGDSTDTEKYTLEIDETKQYLRYEFYFTTGQQGFNSYEIRKFKKQDGSSLIIFSNYGGLKRAFDQNDIYAFIYKNKKLIKLHKQLLPAKMDVNVFLRTNTPDSIRQKAKSYSNCSYDLSPELKNTIAYRLFFQIIDEKVDKYLLGDTVFFTWTGSSLKRGKITHSE